MQCKVFHVVDAKDLEKTVQNWIQQTKVDTIFAMTQSATGSGTTLTILYKNSR